MAYRVKDETKRAISANTSCRIYSGSYTDDTQDVVVREIEINENTTPEEYKEAVKCVTHAFPHHVHWSSALKESGYTPIFLFCRSKKNDFNYLQKLNVDESMFTTVYKRVNEKEKV